MSKICTKCKVEKEFEEFHKFAKNKTDGRNFWCKQCVNAYNIPRMEMEKKRRKEIRDGKKNGTYKIAYKEKDPVIASKIRIEKRREYIKNNREHLNKKRNEHYHKNKHLTRGRDNAAIARRKKECPLLALKIRLRSRIFAAIKGRSIKKQSSSMEILGCSVEFAKKFIERQFKKGMTWKNHGHGNGCWHIDHKIPLSSAKTEEELLLLLHYTNLQPLWREENLSKSDKILPFQVIMPI